jgi:hypothetical protein
MGQTMLTQDGLPSVSRGNVVALTATAPPVGSTHTGDWVYVRDRAAVRPLVTALLVTSPLVG